MSDAKLFLKVLVHANYPSIVVSDRQWYFVQTASQLLSFNEETRQLVFILSVIPIAGVLK